MTPRHSEIPAAPMTPEEKLNRLRHGQSPFASSSVGDPWEGQYPSVESINEHAFQGLYTLIRNKARYPGLACAALVLGEVGSGKTHLIGRLLRHSRESDTPFAFAYIQPIEDPEQTFRYLLRELIVNLSHSIDPSAPLTQIEQILASIFIEIIHARCLSRNGERCELMRDLLCEDPARALGLRLSAASFQALEKEATDLLLRESHHEIPREFLKVLFQYRIEEKRSAVVNWLKGRVLDEDEAALIRAPDRSRVSAAALEDECRLILSALGLLLGRYRQPLVVCFDRLENLDTEAQAHSLGKMVEFLVDKARAMLPVVFARGVAWREKFVPMLNYQVTSRLETNEFELRGCTPDQALRIVRDRLAFVMGEENVDELFPLNREALLRDFSVGFFTPRRVITLANQHLRQILASGQAPLVGPRERLQEEMDRQYEAILSDFDRYQPDRERLRRALELYLGHLPAESRFTVKEVRRPGGGERYIDLLCQTRETGSSAGPDSRVSPESVGRPSVGGGPGAQSGRGASTTGAAAIRPTQIAFIIDVEEHHHAVGASLKRAIDFLVASPSRRAIYIRDERSPIPERWKTTNELLSDFTARGGRVLTLGREQAARWYALAILSYAVREGDVMVTDAGGIARPVTLQDLASYVSERAHGGGHSGFEALQAALSGSGQGPGHSGSSSGSLPPPNRPPPSPVSPPLDESPPAGHPTVDDGLIAARAVEILREAPMMMSTSRKLTESLVRSGMPVTLEGLLQAIGRYRDRFEIFPSRDGVLIMVKKSWIYAQTGA